MHLWFSPVAVIGKHSLQLQGQSGLDAFPRQTGIFIKKWRGKMGKTSEASKEVPAKQELTLGTIEARMPCGMTR
ncbi:hypothetical protein GCM10007100_22910 [Roseibacillus persicicus]|uniref:Uncharacterized protein n=1 Tax=Roseibacillus persicicus TaxID=454148 RepID=A0A918WIT7_9BACT|nr:hypothetical protein GCM10007100_22910 [Roseibacillus persicicus]